MPAAVVFELRTAARQRLAAEHNLTRIRPAAIFGRWKFGLSGIALT